MSISATTGSGDTSGIYEPWLVKGGKQPVPVDSSGHVIGSPLLKAVDDAFKAYTGAVQTAMGKQISGLVSYAVSSKGCQGMTSAQLAPFLALNVMA